MEVLLLGGTGQLGEELRTAAVGSDVMITAPGRDHLDLACEMHIVEWVASKPWSAVINAAAYTEVDRAESELAMAYALNATAPKHLATETNRHGIPLIHISTDYVFDGRKGRPYQPTDAVNPLNVYGASKEAGEQAIRANNPRHIIIRTSWLYSARRKNFVKTMLRLASERDRLSVVDDQRGCPTAAQDLAGACITILGKVAADAERAPYGTYHFAGAGETTWYGFAREIFALARPLQYQVPEVIAIKTADYPLPAARPADTRLDCTASIKSWGVKLRDWHAPLKETLAALVGKEELG